MSPETRRQFEFGPYRLDPAEHRLLREGQVVPLTPKVFDVLRVLVQSSGRLVEKDVLLKEVWPDSFVEEGNLNRTISVLRKALRKGSVDGEYIETVPKRGYRFIAAVTEVLDEAAASSGRVPGWQGAWTLRLAVAAAIVISALGYATARRGPVAAASAPHVPGHRQLTFTGKEGSPSVSPDGRLVAYVTHDAPLRHVTVQDLSSGRHVAVFSAEEANHVRWSPDSVELLFFARGPGFSGIFTLPRIGGTPRLIAQDHYVACWSPDGSTIALGSYLRGVITFVERATGRTRAASLSGDRRSIWDLDWSRENGRLLAVSDDQLGRFEATTIRSDGTDERPAVAAGPEIESARWAPGGHAIYFVRHVDQTASIFKQFLGAGAAIDGVPVPVLTGLATGGGFAVSADGRRFVHARAPYHSNLWLVETSRDAKRPGPSSRALTHGTSLLERPGISPDGKTIAFNVGHSPQANVFTMPIEGGPQEPVTSLPALSVGAVWAPDGRRVAFASTEGGSPHVWVADPGGKSRRAVSAGDMSESLSVVWGPSRRILYQQRDNRDFYLLDPDKLGSEQLLLGGNRDGWVFSPVVSPDGRRTAVVWNRPQQAGIWVLDADGHGKQLIYPTPTRQLLTRPIGWSADGETIFVVQGSGVAWRSVLSTAETTRDTTLLALDVKGGTVKPLVVLPFDEVGGVAITSDGRRIVCAVYSSRSDVWMVDNFDLTAGRGSGLLFPFFH